jgi:glycosyltransferase involved in cell wall biosynthesis
MKHNSALVSVIMPCYNASNTISISIESVLKQSYKNIELIIIDDFSTDNSLSIISNFQKIDERIKLLKNKFNKGVAYSRNQGIEKASGSYIAFLDSDDYWDLNKIYIQMNYMNDNDCDITFTSYYRINSNGVIIGSVNLNNTIVSFDNLVKGNVIAMSSSIIKKDKIHNFYFENIGHEDYLFWLNILKNGNLAYPIESFLTYYRVHNKSLSSNKFIAISYTWSIYRNNLKFPLLKSLYYFLLHIFNSTIKRI